MRARLFAAVVFCVCCLLPWAAGAADPLDPAVVEAGIQAWLAGLLGQAVRLPARPVVVTREGDHDRVAVDAGAVSFGLATADQPVATADIRLSGGIWNVDRLTRPSPLRLNLHSPGKPDVDLATLTTTVGEQSAHALIDPSGQTESMSQGSWRNVDTTIDSHAGHTVQHMDTVADEARLRPGADGRVDLIQMLDATGFRSEQMTPAGVASGMTAARLHIAGHLDGMDTARLGPVLQSAILVSTSVAGVMPAAGEVRTPEKMQAMWQAVDRPALNRLLALLPGVIGGLQVEESADTVTFGTAGQAATAAHFGLGMTADAPGGLLRTKLDLAVDGLAMKLPPAFADLMPRHIALRPTITGLNLAALTAMAQQAASGQAGGPGGALFGPDGLVTTIERLAIDVGPATLTATGKITLRDQGRQGSGTITVSGFDALMTRVGQSPALQQGLPFFVIAKGLSRTEGENLVWDVSYDNGRASINGNDMSALIPGSKPPGR